MKTVTRNRAGENIRSPARKREGALPMHDGADTEKEKKPGALSRAFSYLLPPVLALGAAYYVQSNSPAPIILRAGKPVVIGRIDDGVITRFGKDSSFDISDFVKKNRSRFMINLENGDRVLLLDGSRRNSYFVRGRQKDIWLRQFDERIRKESGNPNASVDLGSSHTIEITPTERIQVVPYEFRGIKARFKHGWARLKKRLFGSNKENERAGFFSMPKKIISVEKRTRYPYSFSPALRYLNYEFAFLQDFQKSRIASFLDNVSNRIAEKLMKAAGTGNINEAIRHHTKSLEGQSEMMRTIAKTLIEAEIIYFEEQLLSRAFDPKANNGDFSHLDCDLLVHVFLHVAYRLDLPLYAAKAPGHMYLIWKDKEGEFAVEATEFRYIERKDGYENKRTYSIGKHFFPTYDYLKSKWHVEKSLQINARFFQPIEEDDLLASVKANVLTGLLEKSEHDKTLRDLTVREMERLVSDNDNPQTHTNLYLVYKRKANEYFEKKEYGLAWRYISKATGIVEKNPGRVIRNSLGSDYDLRARIQLAVGHGRSALMEFRKVIRWYKEQGMGQDVEEDAPSLDEPFARASYHLGLHYYKRGRHSMAYNKHLTFTINYLLNNEPEDKSLYNAYRLASVIFKRQNPEFSREMAERAEEHRR